MNLNVNIEIDPNEIAYKICQEMDIDQVFKHIKNIDLTWANWDLTLKLCEYFAKVQKEYDQENKDFREEGDD